MRTAEEDKPIISVVLGVLNGGSMIERLIDSFASQTLKRKELVIIDGGSTDDTVSILKRRSADIAYWRSEPDRGLYDAWNKALDHCRGKYIGFVGCDDVFADPAALERLAHQAAAQDWPDLVCSLNVFVDDRGKFLKTIGGPWSWKGMTRAVVVAHSCLLHRADLFERYGRFTTQYKIGGDYDFLLRLGPDARAGFVEQITVRVGSSGMSHRLWTTTYREHWLLQARNPNVGPRVATWNLIGNVARYAYRKLRGRR